jgi:2,5-dihydroxypyridine 5,6-dioxygenase
VPLFQRELELCKIQPGEAVLSFTNTATNPSYAAALFGAAGVLGADIYQVVVPANSDWMRSRAIIDAWRAADLVIGMLQSMDTHWVYSDAHNEALEAGTRTLMIEEPEDVLRRLFPSEQVTARVLASHRILDPGTTLRITSDAGTDLRMKKDGRIAAVQYGSSDAPGRFDNWPSGMVSTSPIEESTEGTLVIDAGDVLLPLGRYAESPIQITFREGRAIAIEGGADARLMRDFLESARNEGAFRLSHIGWGSEDRARWSTVGLRFWEGGGVMDSEGYYGNTLIAFGDNFFRNLGGQNRANFHMDVPTRNHSFWVDNTHVMDKGRFVIPELQ